MNIESEIIKSGFKPPFTKEEAQEIWEQEPLSKNFPIIFDKFTWTKLIFTCANCDTLFRDDQSRGRVNLGFKNVAIIQAVCVCENCGNYTGFHMRLYSQGRLVNYKNGQWVDAYPVKTGFFKAIKNILGFS